jgi:hypothetical protein
LSVAHLDGKSKKIALKGKKIRSSGNEDEKNFDSTESEGLYKF